MTIAEVASILMAALLWTICLVWAIGVQISSKDKTRTTVRVKGRRFSG